jgi:hypothetical protein
VLGWSGDLWIARRDGERWVEPLFTGVEGNGRAPNDWFERFVGASPRELARDSDGDGWTDLVEKRLGTDPRNPDTDGDGLPDSQDKNPLTAPRPISEDEQVLVRAFEQAWWSSTGGPAVVGLPEGMRPFELNGSPWIILPAGSMPKWTGNGPYGMAVVSFSPPWKDFAGHALHGEVEGTVLYNDARTEAKVHMESYHGPLAATGSDIHLRKHGGRWLVVGAESIWVS